MLAGKVVFVILCAFLKMGSLVFTYLLLGGEQSRVSQVSGSGLSLHGSRSLSVLAAGSQCGAYCLQGSSCLLGLLSSELS